MEPSINERFVFFVLVAVVSVRLLSFSEAMSNVPQLIQQDWQNREFVEVITNSIKKIAEFLNAFDLSARSRLATLNEKLTHLERHVEYIEARTMKVTPAQ